MTKKNSFPFGFLIGAVAPLVSLPLIYGIIYLIVSIFSMQPFIPLNSLILLSVVPNFIGLRFFYNKQHTEHTGQGILFITVAYVLLFFIFMHGKSLIHLPGLQQ